MIVKMLHDKGLKSEHAYTAAFISIGLSVTSWFGSMRVEPAGVARADRVGIFVGEWAPTFFTLGLALAHYEHDDKPLHSVKTEGEWSDLGG
ncbi:hypothetical protein OG322_36035 [Streptomyces sp. NBC_01260]|uniref:Uncharacterized protein n=1 Tax=Streptomyces laculatispora TaxID=887464 RepID=A0ABY9IDR2_9ACTN|nr:MULTISPECIES: hypothetical protein [Streptomyces]MCX4774622.1 hypothetical protein [Streptomyces sp. NBC_01285]ROQ72847.1 hypothetical protein EDD95_5456 [Streptomyces sp. CEV 2-1]RPK35062.1 hypothetical protein EES39_33825 [Streptomyces sp. ADI92-24]WLQ44799.1 hypothetical protein P8A22_35850 [Streptomyces laculatispora]